MTTRSEPITVCLLIIRKEIRDYFYDLLNRTGYHPVILTNLDELLEEIDTKHEVLVFLDGSAVGVFGEGIYHNIKAASPGALIILLYGSTQGDLVKEAMGSGACGTIREPYADWEVLTTVRRIMSAAESHRPRPSRKTGKPGHSPMGRSKT